MIIPAQFRIFDTFNLKNDDFSFFQALKLQSITAQTTLSTHPEMYFIYPRILPKTPIFRNDCLVCYEKVCNFAK